MKLSLANLKRVAPATVIGLAVLAAACGGGTKAPTGASTSGTSASGGTGGTGAGPATPPGVSGTVAAINGTALEVQGASGQVTVNVSPSTVITQTAAATAADLAVGLCVSATGTKSSSNVVAATSVSINEIPSTTGTCTGGFGGGGAGGAGGFGGGGGFRRGTGAGGSAGGGTTRSTLSPAQRARFANIGVATGKVTTINGDMVDVAVPTPAATTTTTTTRGSSTTTPRPRITPAGSFSYSSSTTFTKTTTAAISALAVNQCVTAFGSSGNTGAVTATRLTIRPPVNGTCSTAVGGGGRFFGGGGFGGGGGAGAGA